MRVHFGESLAKNLYGVTNDLNRRLIEHREGLADGFTKRYRIHRLVYFETFRYITNAIAREKEIKGWDRERRLKLIEAVNPTWQDYAESWLPSFARKADPSLRS